MGSKSKDELAKSMPQASSSSGTIPAKGPGRGLHGFHTPHVVLIPYVMMHLYSNFDTVTVTVMTQVMA